MTQSKQHITGLRAWLARHGYHELAVRLPIGCPTPRQLIKEDRALAAFFRAYQ
jgi:hypothetical protein